MLRYSTRLSRRSVTWPGSGLAGSRPKASVSIQWNSASRSSVGRLLFLGRRHHAGADVLQHRPPELGVGEHRVVGGELVERAAAFARPVAVAAVAILLEDRLDFFAVAGSAAVGSSATADWRKPSPATKHCHGENCDSSHHRSCRPRIVIRRGGSGGRGRERASLRDTSPIVSLFHPPAH